MLNQDQADTVHTAIADRADALDERAYTPGAGQATRERLSYTARMMRETASAVVGGTGEERWVRLAVIALISFDDRPGTEDALDALESIYPPEWQD